MRNVGTSITTGGDLTLVSEGNQLYQRARLESGNDLTLESGGSITFEAVKDLEQESHEKSSNGSMWTSSKGEGKTDETLLQSQLIAQGEIAIRAAEGLKIDITHIDNKSVGQTIDAMVQADPQLAWLKEAEARGDVDWRRVKEIHDSWDYAHSGLGGGAVIIIAIIVTALTAGAAGALMTAVTNLTGSAALGAGAVGIAQAHTIQTVVSTINNKGNIGAVFKDVHSSDNLKSYATAGISAGVVSGVVNPTFGGADASKVMSNGHNLGTVDGAFGYFKQAGATAVVQAGVGTAINGGSFKDNLNGALLTAAQNTVAAVAFNAVGDWGKANGFADGSPQKVAMHALVGGLLSEASGGDFATGALAAGVNEAFVEQLNALVKQDKDLLLMASQLIGVAAAVASDGDAQLGADIAKNATSFNYLSHQEMADLRDELERCKGNEDCLGATAGKFHLIHLANEEAQHQTGQNGNLADNQQIAMEIERAVYEFQTGAYGVDDARAQAVLASFHTVNLDGRSASTGYVAGQSIKEVLDALGLPNTPEVVAAATTAAAAYMGGKRVVTALKGDGTGKQPPKSPNPTSPQTDSETGLPYSHNVKDSSLPKGKVDITDGRAGHILANHRYGAGKPNKTEFPKSWDDNKILYHVSDVATDPTLPRQYDNRGTPYVVGIREGMNIRVNFYPDNGVRKGRVATAYPLNTTQNSK